MVTTILTIIGGIVVGIIAFLLLVILGMILASYAIEDPESTADTVKSTTDSVEYYLWAITGGPRVHPYDTPAELVKTYDNGDYISGKGPDIKEYVISEAIKYLEEHPEVLEVCVYGAWASLVFSKKRNND